MRRARQSTVCFGELLLRLGAPGRTLLMQTPALDINVGGAEANVAVALARLGHRAALVSAVPDNALGEGAVAAIRAHGVDCSAVAVRDGRMGLYFLAAGAGRRASAIVYDRAASSFATAPADQFDWPALLADAGRLHMSGITPALGPGPAAAALAAAEAATELGVPVSFDVNYRASLWASDPRAVLNQLVAHADLLFGNHRDVALLLGREFDGGDPAGRRDAAVAAFAAFPRLRLIASTRREILDADEHRLAARLDVPDTGCETEPVAVTGIVDRIGAGDAFAAGVLHGLAMGHDLERTAHIALALACLKHSLPGDASRFGQADIDAWLDGSQDVRR